MARFWRLLRGISIFGVTTVLCILAVSLVTFYTVHIARDDVDLSASQKSNLGGGIADGSAEIAQLRAQLARCLTEARLYESDLPATLEFAFVEDDTPTQPPVGQWRTFPQVSELSVFYMCANAAVLTLTPSATQKYVGTGLSMDLTTSPALR